MMNKVSANSWVRFDADIGWRCGNCFDSFNFDVSKQGRCCPMCGISKVIDGKISIDDRSVGEGKQTCHQYLKELKARG